MLQEDYTPLTFAPVISYKLVAGVFRFARGGCFLKLTTDYTDGHRFFINRPDGIKCIIRENLCNLW